MYLARDALRAYVCAFLEQEVDDGIAFSVLQTGCDHERCPAGAILWTC